MALAEHAPSKTSDIPLIDLPPRTKSGNDADAPFDWDQAALESTAQDIVNALKSSGFLLVRSEHLSESLQKEALETTAQVLLPSSTTFDKSKDDKDDTLLNVIQHPTDPKLYMMLSRDEIQAETLTKLSKVESPKESSKVGSTTEEDQKGSRRPPSEVLKEYWEAMETIKKQVLTCIALGLKLEKDYFVKLHSQQQSSLRLLHYPSPEVSSAEDKESTLESTTGGETKPTNKSPPTKQKKVSESKIRCKPHSDYGSITLLSTDGVPGLEALIQNEWRAVPYVKGALVVNIGSLLQDWTNGNLLATLHRVVDTSQDARTSLAFFADPDPDVSATLKDPSAMIPTSHMYRSVADYVLWRSGGTGRQRSGLAFSKEEEERAKRARIS